MSAFAGISFSGLSMSPDDFNKLIKSKDALSPNELDKAIAAVKMDAKLTNLLSMFSNIENVSLAYDDGAGNTAKIDAGKVIKELLKVATVEPKGGINDTGFTFTYDGNDVTEIKYANPNPGAAGATGPAPGAAPAAPGAITAATGSHGGSRRRRRRRRKNKSYKKHSS